MFHVQPKSDSVFYANEALVFCARNARGEITISVQTFEHPHVILSENYFIDTLCYGIFNHLNQLICS